MTTFSRTVPLLLALASTAGAQTLSYTTEPASGVDVPRFGVHETMIAHDDAAYSNPFLDVDVLATFTAPHGEEIEVGGFYYDVDEWRVRFAPHLAGDWSFEIVLTEDCGPDDSWTRIQELAEKDPRVRMP